MPHSDHGADAHTWTELLSRTRFGTQKALGKSVSGARIHAVGERLARYATHKTGRDIRPGLARIAADMEMDYRSVKAAVSVLVRVGLLHLVDAGGRPGEADEYQLVIPVDLLDREDIEVLSPAKYRLDVDRLREKVRGKYRRTADLRGPVGPQPAGASGTADDEPAGACGTAESVPADEPAGAPRAADPGPAGACGTNLRSQRTPPPPIDHVPNYDLPNRRDVRTAVTGPRARDDEPPISDDDEEHPGDPPTHRRGCTDHGPAFDPGTRPDGKPACPLCRATSAHRTGDLAPVIPIRSAS